MDYLNYVFGLAALINAIANLIKSVRQGRPGPG